ncbi:MAG: bifunctional (p)ppGpp synthetase/guanosine-3',5'-bis(diphosphate) 3'-pyrophosphohydrolase, partial [Chitinivibrionales bacterium]|nr:bifunctional (p)ppGpp synthetase/guanosine-3',5'-bis(diphosphate) 3'-pyrophosphohydrolase [Chitinivibrionales bacterium]
KIYTPADYQLSLLLFDEIKKLNLDDICASSGFFIRAPLSDPLLRKTIEEHCGKVVLSNAELLRRLAQVVFPETKKNIDTFRKLFIKLADDLTIIFIKLLERLVTLVYEYNNQNTLTGDLNKTAQECLYLYAPIAHRLGIRKIATEMEDLAFRCLFKDECSTLERETEKKRLVYEAKLRDMAVTLKTMLKQSSIPCEIQYRVKRPYSIYRKQQNKQVELSEIYDLLALRVITDTRENCYLTLGLVHRSWISIEGRFRDWISYPKPNGYRSIQTTVLTRSGDKFEIQIKTQQMHREAEYGAAAHWGYKEGVAVEDEWILRLKEFLENDEYFENPHAVLEMLKAEMKSEYIHVLTPKGEVKTLLAGSTPIDFAYAIHTDIGNTITGSRVNGKFVSLKHQLKSGDVIDVVTNKNSKPSRDWLDSVKTSKARSKIRDWFLKNEKTLSIVAGKRKWDRLKKRYTNRFSSFDDDKNFKNNLMKLSYKTAEDFFNALGAGSIKCDFRLLRTIYRQTCTKNTEESPVSSVKKPTSGPSSSVIIEGLTDIETSLARCCNPIKGEKIRAYITKNRGIKIHASDCPHLFALAVTSPQRFKDASWLMDNVKQMVRAKIISDNDDRVLSEIISIAEKMGIGLVSVVREPVVKTRNVYILEIMVENNLHFDQFKDKILSLNVEMFKVL